MHIIVFFTFDVSLKLWYDTGLAARELLIYEYLVKQGFKVAILTYGDDSDTQFRKLLGGIHIIPVYKYLKRPGNLVLRLLQSLLIPLYLKDMMKAADVYKTNQMYGAWIPVIAKILYGKKLVVRCGYEYLHDALVNASNFLQRTIKFIPRYILEFCSYQTADAIAVSSQFSMRYITKAFGLHSGKIAILPNYIDIRRFKPYATSKKSKTKNGAMVFVGRLHPIKNLCTLIEAVNDTDYQLDIIGTGVQEAALRKYAGHGNSRINFLGVFSNNKIARMLGQYELFVLPSLYENNPKALLEAMACGLAVIGADVAGIKEIIRHGENGWLCGTDAPSIRKAIQTLMNDSGLRRKIGSKARETIAADYAFDMIAAKELQIYAAMN